MAEPRSPGSDPATPLSLFRLVPIGSANRRRYERAAVHLPEGIHSHAAGLAAIARIMEEEGIVEEEAIVKEEACRSVNETNRVDTWEKAKNPNEPPAWTETGENPFNFCDPVSDDRFINRKEELFRLKSYLRNGRDVLLVSPGGYGKTSLILRALRDLDGSVIGILPDAAALRSPADLATALSRSSSPRSSLSRLRSTIQRLLLGIELKITIETDPAITISPVYAGSAETWKTALSLPVRLAREKNCRVVLVFEHFALAAGTVLLQYQLKEALYHLKEAFGEKSNVSCCFLLDRPHMISRLFGSPSGPLSASAALLSLPPLPMEATAQAIARMFWESGIRTAPGLPQTICERVRGHPRSLMRICYELWQRGSSGITPDEDDLDDILRGLVAEADLLYSSLYWSLPTNQRKVLLAVAAGEEKLYAGACMRRFHLASAGSVHAGLRGLHAAGLVWRAGSGYWIPETLFLLWIRERNGLE